MSEKIPVAGLVVGRGDSKDVPFVIKYDGIFDLDALYVVIQRWITDQGFYFEEKTFKHKVPSPAGSEQDYDLVGWRKINEYVMYHIQAYVKIYNLKDIEVIKEGRKRKLTKGQLKIYVSGQVELDYSNRFEKNKFLLSLREFYHKYIIKKGEGIIGGVWWDQLYYHVFKLHAAIKEQLDMESKSNAYYDMWQ